MKKLKNIYLVVLLSIAFSFVGVAFLQRKGAENLAYAQTTALPEYSTFFKYEKTETEGEYTRLQNSQIKNGDAVFLSSGQVAIFELGNPVDFPHKTLSSLTLDISINGVRKGNEYGDYVKEHEANGNENANWVKLMLDPYEGDAEGRYDVYTEYFNEFGIKQILKFNFYLYKQNTYFSNIFPAVTLQNVKTTVAADSSPFYRTHEFNYNNNLPSAQSLSLPTISFDANKFEVSISKTYSGQTQTTYIKTDQNGLVSQTNEIVMLKQGGENNNTITVTFNDIGVYNVNYHLIYKNNEKQVEFFSNINSTMKYDRVILFGFQVYHSDINNVVSNTKKEFKVLNQDNTINRDYQTDITYAMPASADEDEEHFEALEDNTLFKIKDIDSRIIFNNNMDKDLTAPSTNQAPVEFKYNANIVIGESFYWKLHSKQDDKNIWERLPYNGHAFTDVGTYLVKVRYESSFSLSSSAFTQWFYFTISNQVPSFNINEQTPDGQMPLNSGNFTKNSVAVSFNQKQNPFDSPSTLTVFSRQNTSQSWSSPIKVDYDSLSTFSQNGMYRVVMNFGRGLSKLIASEFTIDNRQITGLIARSSSKQNNAWIKGSQVDFYTNQNVFLEWNEKSDNNNTISTFYKFIPIVQSSTSPSSANYSTYYSQGQLVPVQYELSYNKVNALYPVLSQIPYQNTIRQNNLEGSSVLTQQGLYLVKAVDKAGNEAYTSFVIDRTSPVILQKDSSNNYLTDYSQLNMVSDGVTVQWGKYKVIYTNIDAPDNKDTWLNTGQENTDLDPWLHLMLTQKANTNTIFSQTGDFKFARNLSGVEKLHFAVEIKTDNVLISSSAIQGNPIFNINAFSYGGASYDKNNNHLKIRVTDADLVQGIPASQIFETSYTIFVNDESNSLGDYLTTHSVITSTDISQTQIKFKHKDSPNTEFLDLHQYSQGGKLTDDFKSSYYIPINTNIVTLQYLPTIQASLVEIESIIVNYYPYISNYLIYTGTPNTMLSNTYYTLDEEIIYTGETKGNLTKNQSYSLEKLLEEKEFEWKDFQVGKSFVLAKKPVVFTIFDYEKNINQGTPEGDKGLYAWDINIETLNVSGIEINRTMAGKYEIVRKYEENAISKVNVKEKNDFMIRNLTFILERNMLVSDPVTKNLNPDPNGIADFATFSLVGGSTFIEVLALNQMFSGESENIYSQLYNANNLDISFQSPLIETNKLPVRLGFPIYKLGQVINNNFTVNASNLFYSNDINSYINSFEMSLSVKHLPSNEDPVKSNVTVTLQETIPAQDKTYFRLDNGLYAVIAGANSNGYILIGEIDAKTGLQKEGFTREGKYEVTLSTKNKSIKGDSPSLTFYFTILSAAPDFSVQDTMGNQLPKDDSTELYFVNKQFARILWSDPTNTFLAKIDKAAIRYYVGNSEVTVTAEQLKGSLDGFTHWFDINTNLYDDGTEIIVRMQYEGKQSDYPAGAFSRQKSIIIDKTAPTHTIDKLIEKIGESSIFNAQTLRLGHNLPNGYNKTITTGSFKGFAFAVDSSDLQTLINESFANGTHQMYYRPAANKYTDPGYVEFDPEQPDALLQITSGSFMHINTVVISELEIGTYYEIVEIDKSGNITSFSIYLTDINKLIQDELILKENNLDLSDEMKIISFTNYTSGSEINSIQRFETPLSIANSQNNLKIYSKQFFKLDNINAYGYDWFVLTFANNKYIASPHLNQTVYKVTSEGWTEVNLANEIYLTTGRSNYSLTLKNLPLANITMSVVVSNNELVITAPSNQNASLIITQTKANDTDFVQWAQVEIWEYQGGNYSARAVFVPSQQTPISYSPEEQGFNLATYQTQGGITTFNIAAKNGAYYRYKITDNFGHDYILYNLHGQQYQEKIVELGKDQLLIENINGEDYYISNQGFKYTFYPAITKTLIIEIGVFNINTNQYVWENFEYNSTAIFNPSFGRIDKFASYSVITLQPATAESDEYTGASVIYKITAESITSDTEIGAEEELHNFKVYSILPKTILKGENRQDLSALLLKEGGLTSEEITIEFANTSNFDYPVVVFLQFNDETPYEIQSGQTFKQPGRYRITKTYPSAVQFGQKTEEFKISDSQFQFYSVVQYNSEQEKYVEVEQAPLPYIIQNAINLPVTAIMQHYIVNTSDWKIELNSSQFMEIIDEYEVKKNNVTTFIITVSNKHVDSTNKSIRFFEKVIAVTYIPKSNKILSSFRYLDSKATPVALKNSEEVYALIKDKDAIDTVTIQWQNFYLVPENKITAHITYGQNKQEVSPSTISTSGNLDFITISRSGNYSLAFTDQAGNTHKFDYNSQLTERIDAYEFVFLNSVIITVNEQPAIQNAIFNGSVQITLPSNTMAYYDVNAKPKISVIRNGENYLDYTHSTNTRTYTFTEQGLYQVVFSAKHETEEIKEQPYVFEIIRENAYASEFDVQQYQNYYIEKIVKNGVDVTNALSNNTLGKTMQVVKDGVSVTRLRNIFISLQDEQTGAGTWQITINTNNDIEQTYTFGFKIDHAINAPIIVSLDEGASTTKPITVKFNARNLYDQVGESTVIVGNRVIELNEEYFSSSGFVDNYEIVITAIGDTYIQIKSPSGRLHYTYKVTRVQPLNSVAIIVIVVSALAATGLVIMFVLLRKRMKIR